MSIFYDDNEKLFKKAKELNKKHIETRDILRDKNTLEELNKKDGLKCTLNKFCGFKKKEDNLCFRNKYCYYQSKEELQRRLIKKNSTIEEIISIEKRLGKPLDKLSLMSIIDFAKCEYLTPNLLRDENGLIFNVDTHKLITLKYYTVIPLK